MKKPKIAVMLDENTSKGGDSYELSKNYFRAISHAGGLPYGIPYCDDFMTLAVQEFDGFFSVGSGTALPPEWYNPGHHSPYPASERTAVELGIMKAFLDADKPVFGSCNGMQVLAGLYGCKMQVGLGPEHRAPHAVEIVAGTRTAALMGVSRLEVNSRHSEYITDPTPAVTVTARGLDGVIEGIEIPGKKLALGLQWHQEDFWDREHAGNGVLGAFVGSC